MLFKTWRYAAELLYVEYELNSRQLYSVLPSRNSTPCNNTLFLKQKPNTKEKTMCSLESKLNYTQKNSTVWRSYSTTSQKNAAPWIRNSSQRRRTLLFGAGTQPWQKNAVPWSRNSSQQRRTPLFRARTQLQAEERCSLEQELISTKKNSALWSRNSTTKQKSAAPWNRNPSHCRKTTLLFGSGTHLNAEGLCSLEQ